MDNAGLLFSLILHLYRIYSESIVMPIRPEHSNKSLVIELYLYIYYSTTIKYDNIQKTVLAFSLYVQSVLKFIDTCNFI